MNDRKKILVVDDEPDVLEYLSALFQDNGYTVVTAVNGKQAVDLAIAERPDLITLDMTMPEESGVRAFRKFKEDDVLRRIPVVIITAIGDSMKNFIHKLKGFPEPEGFLSKPIDQDELLKTTTGLLGGK